MCAHFPTFSLPFSTHLSDLVNAFVLSVCKIKLPELQSFPIPLRHSCPIFRASPIGSTHTSLWVYLPILQLPQLLEAVPFNHRYIIQHDKKRFLKHPCFSVLLFPSPSESVHIPSFLLFAIHTVKVATMEGTGKLYLQVSNTFAKRGAYFHHKVLRTFVMYTCVIENCF